MLGFPRRKRRALFSKGGRNGKESGFAAKAVAVLGAAAALGFVAWGLHAGYASIHRIALEPCIMTNAAAQVSVRFGDKPDGRYLKRDTVLDFFGLTNGVNVAQVDFAKKRKVLLELYPIAKDAAVEWLRPANEVRIDIQERMPVVQIQSAGRSRRRFTCDEEGVVLDVPGPKGVKLPRIILKPDAGTKPGDVLSGRAMAALRLVAAAKTFAQELSLVSVDTRKPDCLVAEFGKPYSVNARISWRGMDDHAPDSAEDLAGRLRRLSQVLKSGQRDEAKLLDATDDDPKRITAR